MIDNLGVKVGDTLRMSSICALTLSRSDLVSAPGDRQGNRISAWFIKKYCQAEMSWGSKTTTYWAIAFPSMILAMVEYEAIEEMCVEQGISLDE